MTKKIVISDLDHQTIETENSVLHEHGLSCDWRCCISEDEVIAGCADAAVLLIQYARITRRVMEALPELKLVVRYGVGFDTIDVAAARELGVQVCNIPDYGSNEVADQAMAHTLSLVRKLHKTNADIRAGVWDFNEVMPISRMSCMTCGIVGLGRIGSRYAKRMNAFDVRVIAHDIKPVDAPEYVMMTTLDKLLSESDIISIHCPADGNIDLIAEPEFAKMKDGAILINVSRGGIVNEAALDRALKSKKLAGCGLDVAMVEPISPESPLLQHKNLTVSPHMAWYSEESARELKRKVAQEAVRFVSGQPVHYSVL